MKYTQDQMQAIISEWQNSGLSKKTFCRDREIGYQTFHYWYKRLSSAPSGFVEVTLSNSRPESVLELNFPSGVRMTLQGQPSAVWLRELLK